MTTNDDLIALAISVDPALDSFRWLQTNNTTFVSVDDVEDAYFSVQLLYTDLPVAAFGGSPVGVTTSCCAVGGVRGCVMTVQMFYMGSHLTPAVESACAPLGAPSRGLCRCQFAEWIELPIRLCDVPLDATVRCDVYGPQGHVAYTSFSVFTIHGEVKAGPWLYQLRSAAGDDSRRVGPEEEQLGGSDAGNDQVTPPAWEVRSRLLQRGAVQAVPWLDAITSAHLDTLRESCTHGHSACTGSVWTEELAEDGPLQQQVTGSSGCLRVCLPVPSNRLPVFRLATEPEWHTDGVRGGVGGSTSENIVDAFRATSTRIFADYSSALLRERNLSEAAAGILAKSLYITADASGVPGFKDRQRLEDIVRRPPIQLDAARVEDTWLLWRHRRFIRRDARFLVPFIRSVDWGNAQSAECRAAAELLPTWKPIPFADVLVCLSAAFRGVVAVRQYAVRLLDRESDAQLCRFAAQLVQSVQLDTADAQELATFLLQRAVGSWELCSTLYWAITVEVLLDRGNVSGGGPTEGAAAANRPSSNRPTSPSEVFLQLRRRFQETLLSERPHFLVRLRQQQRLHKCLESLDANLVAVPGDRSKRIEAGRALLRSQSCGFAELFGGAPDLPAPMAGASPPSVPPSSIGITSSHSGAGTPNAAAEVMGALYRSGVYATGVVPLPTHPTVFVDGVNSEDFFIFKSTKQPMRVSFSTASYPQSHPTPAEAPLPAEEEDRRAAFIPIVFAAEQKARLSSSPSSFPSGPLAIDMMFKVYDDVRQDQLIMQLIQLMDSLLKQDGLDLCLTPYRVMATAPSKGLVEVVPDVVTFQSVQGDVLKHLRKYNPTSAKLKDALDRFTKSFSGYSVITFVLGIGDRHLENILLARDGRLLHVDFGYILGSDPKPFPPPMKINQEMVEVLGGPQSAGYQEFKVYSCSAYSIIRKHASLLLNTLLLMCQCVGMPQITGFGNTDPRMNLLKVQERLRLDLNNVQATQHLQNVIADSVGFIFTNLWDTLHAAAQATRA